MLFQIAAFIILAAFYGCYFIKMISQKRKRIQTDLMGKGKTGIAKYIEITMKAVTYLVPVAEVSGILLHTVPFPTWIRAIGLGIGVAGVTIFMISVLTMRDSWRAGVPESRETELVTSGIYQISRNPAFLGFDLVYIGILFMFFNWGLFVVSAAAMLMFHLQIVNVEEEFLLASFGEDYIAYKSTVNRYFGRRRKS